MERWHDFFLSEVGASAALAGLVFVGVSINLKAILESPRLVDRALETILELLLVLLIASLTLMPDQSPALLGGEVTALAAVGAVIVAVLDGRDWKTVKAPYRGVTVLYNLLTISVTVPFLVGGVSLLAGRMWGLDVMAYGILLAFCVSIYNAWVLLIEILR